MDMNNPMQPSNPPSAPMVEPVVAPMSAPLAPVEPVSRSRTSTLVMGALVVFILVLLITILFLVATRPTTNTTSNTQDTDLENDTVIEEDDDEALEITEEELDDQSSDVENETYENEEYGISFTYPSESVVGSCGVAGLNGSTPVTSICPSVVTFNDQAFDGLSLYVKETTDTAQKVAEDDKAAWESVLGVSANAEFGNTGVGGETGNALFAKNINGEGITTVYFKHPTKDFVFAISYTEETEGSFETIVDTLDSITFN